MPNVSDNGLPYKVPNNALKSIVNRIRSTPDLIAFDIECTTRMPKEKGFPGSPFWFDNSILVAGVASDHTVNLRRPSGGAYPSLDILEGWGDDTIIAGHNLVFDLHWLRRYTDWHSWDIRKLTFWDTQVAAYILSSHRMRMCSLEEAAAVWLEPWAGSNLVKVGPVSEMIKAGKIEEVSADDLDDYLRQDLRLTLAVARAQIAHANHTGQTKLILAMCEFLKAVQEMEWNGMHVDRDLLTTYLSECNALILNLNTLAHNTVTTMLTGKAPNQVINEFRNLTPKQVSLLMFGGKYGYSVRVNAGYYKTGARAGQTKYKTEKETFEYVTHLKPGAVGSEKLKTGWWKVDETVLKNIINLGAGYPLQAQLAKLLLDLRGYEKLTGTYLQGIERLIDMDGVVHPNIHTTSTRTGRCSASSPNMQNVPMEVSDEKSPFAIFPVKRLFCSRHGSDGVMVEIDWKQLEVVGLAAVTKDPVLWDDLCSGKDIHNETGIIAFGFKAGEAIPKDIRRVVKTINFGLIYGGSAPTLAEQAGTDLHVARKVVQAFNIRYDTISGYYNDSMIPDCEYKKDTGDFEWRSTTERTYSIMAVPAPEWKTSSGAVITPAYTKVKNYPVQGLATGDFVPCITTMMYHEVMAMREELIEGQFEPPAMCNTVHDSVLFDVHEEQLEVFINRLEGVLRNAHDYFYRMTGSSVFNGLPLKYEITYGRNWNDQEEYLK